MEIMSEHHCHQQNMLQYWGQDEGTQWRNLRIKSREEGRGRGPGPPAPNHNKEPRLSSPVEALDRS
ncbi:hypothetical protein EYF80_039535 [Liparis tanakae]|uniref:Uncharacterized protein n=1 Tax=Liparis tanakae TaxID=230148 RepID=A0A4Z2GAK2_9TELE|nr:hypothetical protein EYF80_039535 [Liparis tanakae]